MSKKNPVIEAIRTRRSVRGYQPGPVSRQQLETIIDCGRLAPSSFNEQAWEFVVVTDPDRLKQIAKLAPDNAPFLADATACIAVTGVKGNSSVLMDCSAATQNMLLAAHALQLGACWIQCHKKTYTESVMALLQIPVDQALVSMISIGVPFTEVETPEKRPLTEVLHWEKF